MAHRCVHCPAVAESEHPVPPDCPGPRVVLHVPVLGQVPDPRFTRVGFGLGQLGQDNGHGVESA
eukprot:3784497-Alexandrium_andersonii.AAC.1